MYNWHVLPRGLCQKCCSVDPVVLVISLVILPFPCLLEKIISLEAFVRQEVVSVFLVEGSVIRLLMATVLLTKESENTAVRD